MFTAALFTTAKTWTRPKCPSTDEWIKKGHVRVYIYTYICVYIHMYIYTHTVDYYLALNEMMPFAATWLDPEIIILSEVKEKDKYHEIAYMQNLKHSTN